MSGIASSGTIVAGNDRSELQIAEMNQRGAIRHPSSSPTTYPHAGFHPASLDQGFVYPSAFIGVGTSSSNASSTLGMSISPPHWGMGPSAWGPSGSFVGSVGALGTSFGRERDRELEAQYVRDFACCGRQLNGLHELLEHYEEEHANLPPDVRMAAINAAQSGQGNIIVSPRPLPPAQAIAQSHSLPPVGPGLGPSHGDAPTPPGMMDIEMEDTQVPSTSATFLQVQNDSRLVGVHSAPSSPWISAFRTVPSAPSAPGVPPSLLSFPPSGPVMVQQSPTLVLTPEQIQARAIRKAQRKAEKTMSRDEASVSDAEGDKRFPCPIEGCGKVYKQANGLKYHLTRSINSGHGNVAALGGLAALLGEEGRMGM